MATRTNVQLIDDLDGGEATETVDFALDGVGYEIDLSATHADALRECLHEWVNAARRINTQRSMRDTGPRSHGANRGELSRDDREHLRVWAMNNDYRVGKRGRIPMRIQREWIAAGRPEK